MLIKLVYTLYANQCHSLGFKKKRLSQEQNDAVRSLVIQPRITDISLICSSSLPYVASTGTPCHSIRNCFACHIYGGQMKMHL